MQSFVALPQSPVCPLEQQLRMQGLVNIQELDASFLVELKYSTTDNFFGFDAYGCLTQCFLQEAIARKLVKAHFYLKGKDPNLRLLIYDGARPTSVQQILWDSIQVPPKDKPRYVAPPSKGSIHSYGCAVDLTIANQTGTPLDMGTPFDFFGDEAYPRKETAMLAQGRLSKQQIANRQLLREVMRKAGFYPITSEWWHFNGMSRKQAKARYKPVE